MLYFVKAIGARIFIFSEKKITKDEFLRIKFDANPNLFLSSEYPNGRPRYITRLDDQEIRLAGLQMEPTSELSYEKSDEGFCIRFKQTGYSFCIGDAFPLDIGNHRFFDGSGQGIFLLSSLYSTSIQKAPTFRHLESYFVKRCGESIIVSSIPLTEFDISHIEIIFNNNSTYSFFVNGKEVFFGIASSTFIASQYGLFKFKVGTPVNQIFITGSKILYKKTVTNNRWTKETVINYDIFDVIMDNLNRTIILPNNTLEGKGVEVSPMFPFKILKNGIIFSSVPLVKVITGYGYIPKYGFDAVMVDSSYIGKLWYPGVRFYFVHIQDAKLWCDIEDSQTLWWMSVKTTTKVNEFLTDKAGSYGLFGCTIYWGNILKGLTDKHSEISQQFIREYKEFEQWWDEIGHPNLIKNEENYNRDDYDYECPGIDLFFAELDGRIRSE